MECSASVGMGIFVSYASHSITQLMVYWFNQTPRHERDKKGRATGDSPRSTDYCPNTPPWGSVLTSRFLTKLWRSLLPLRSSLSDVFNCDQFRYLIHQCMCMSAFMFPFHEVIDMLAFLQCLAQCLDRWRSSFVTDWSVERAVLTLNIPSIFVWIVTSWFLSHLG